MDRAIDWTNVVACIGAAAWVPHICYWLYAVFSKPKLKFVPGATSEIGYHWLGGPIFNQTFAVSTSKKEALIERISLVIVHESGEKHNFHWRFLDEKGFEMTHISGERAEFRKNQPAIALKVSPLGLVEKKIFFQDVDFYKKYNSLLNKFSEQELYLTKTAGSEAKDNALKLKEFQDMLDFIKTGFYWREGVYNVTLFAFEASLKKPHVEHFQFALSKREAERLGGNIETIQKELKTRVSYKGTPFKEWPPQPSLNWSNPSFVRVKLGSRQK